MKPAAFAVESLLRLEHGGLESAGTGSHRYVLQVICKCCPIGVIHFAGRELGERIARDLAEAFDIKIIERYADDSASRDEPRTRQMKHPGQQLAPSQVARGADEHHDLRELRTNTGMNLCHQSHPVQHFDDGKI